MDKEDTHFSNILSKIYKEITIAGIVWLVFLLLNNHWLEGI